MLVEGVPAVTTLVALAAGVGLGTAGAEGAGRDLEVVLADGTAKAGLAISFLLRVSASSCSSIDFENFWLFAFCANVTRKAMACHIPL